MFNYVIATSQSSGQSSESWNWLRVKVENKQRVRENAPLDDVVQNELNEYLN